VSGPVRKSFARFVESGVNQRATNGLMRNTVSGPKRPALRDIGRRLGDWDLQYREILNCHEARPCMNRRELPSNSNVHRESNGSSARSAGPGLENKKQHAFGPAKEVGFVALTIGTRPSTFPSGRLSFLRRTRISPGQGAILHSTLRFPFK